ncbi:hypothetical protein D3C71_1195630 [compost metagenome]
MTATFTIIGFICACLIVLALTLYVLAVIADLLFVKWSGPMRCFRFIWRFYKSLPNTKFGREGRYWIALYDKDEQRFVRTVPLNREFQTEEEYDAEIAEFKRNNTRKRGEKVDVT